MESRRNRDENGSRINKLIVYFQELLDATPDNPDPESEDAIERQQLHARIKSLENRKQGSEAAIIVMPDATGGDAIPGRLGIYELQPPTDVSTRPASSAERPTVPLTEEEPTVRIVLVDDHEVVRRGLASLLMVQSGWKVVAEAETGESAIEMVKQHKPDVTLMNFSMPLGRLDGLEATREIMRDMPEMRILFHTMHASKQLVREILEAGARGYVMQSDAVRDLIKAVKTVLEGNLFFTQTISEILLDGFLEKLQPMRMENLITKREREIIALLARGKSNKEVAMELNISLRTAETHRANFMNKLQLHSVPDLLRYAIKNKLVES